MKVNMVYYNTVSTFHSSHKLYETCHKVIWLRLCLIFLLSTGNHLPLNSIEWDIKIFSGSIELAKIFNHFNLLLNKMFKLLSKSWCSECWQNIFIFNAQTKFCFPMSISKTSPASWVLQEFQYNTARGVLRVS